MDADYRPRLRPMTIMRAQVEGKKVLVIQDPQGVANTIMLPADIENVLLMMNGESTLRDIQVELSRQLGGQIVPIDDIKALVAELDQNNILDSDRFRESIDIAAHFWSVFRIRKPHHAGQAYEKDPAKLRETIDGFYTGEGGPGLPKEKGKGAFVHGILAPHIDIGNGGPTFALAFREIMESPRADLYILLGTAHHMSPGPFSLTLKDYMTPFGIAPTDVDFARSLLDRFNPPWLEHDLVHKTEHSVEFQVVFLQHALGADVPVLPILAGFHHPAGEGTNPWDDADTTGFLDALERTVEASGKKVTYIVGGDLAHIGPRYGDFDPVIPADIDVCSKRDIAMLEEAATGGAKAFYNYVAAENDERNICGLSPLYSMLRLLNGKPGKLLGHSHWMDEQTRSAVTFASMVWK